MSGHVSGLVLSAAILCFALAAHATPPEAVSEATSAESTNSEATSSANSRRSFKPPQGFQKRLRDGKEVYCRRIQPPGSRILRTECFTEAQIEAIEEAQQAYKDDMRRQGVICADERCRGS